LNRGPFGLVSNALTTEPPSQVEFSILSTRCRYFYAITSCFTIGLLQMESAVSLLQQCCHNYSQWGRKRRKSALALYCHVGIILLRTSSFTQLQSTDCDHSITVCSWVKRKTPSLPVA